jgi:hypothetical protein
MVASLAALAQETGIVAEQGEIVRKRSKLCFLNSTEKVVIPDAELMQLLDEEAYDTYCNGRRLFKIGTGLKYGGYTAFAVGLGVGALGVHYMRTSESDPYWEDDRFNTGGRLFMLGILSFIYGNGMIPTGYILRGIGAGKISRIAEEYNENNPTTAISYRISPSIMPVNVPQSQGNVAYGMTFSVNF